MVSAPTGVQTDLPEVVHPSCRLICHSPEPQAPTVRVSYPRPKGLGHRCSKHKLDQPHSLCVPSYGSPSQGDPKDQAMPLPDHHNSPRLARDALVLGPSAALNRDPTTTPSVNDPTQTVPQVCVPQQPPAPEPPRLVSRSGQLQDWWSIPRTELDLPLPECSLGLPSGTVTWSASRPGIGGVWDPWKGPWASPPLRSW